MLKNISVVGFSHSTMYLNTFLRGVFLARILGPHQYGLALILITITAALDMFADAGIDRFIVQNRFGHRADVLATSHAFRVAGSTLVGLAIVALAYPLAYVFHAPELWTPMALTGGITVIRGFVNLSYKLQQRDHRFSREAAIDITTYTSELAVTTLLALWTHSYWSVLAGSYVNAALHLLISNYRPPAPYSFIPRRRLIPLVGRFSLPIYLNAALLLAAAQGDRMVVAATFSKAQLAFYAASSAVGQGINGLANNMTMKTLLPILAARGQDHETRRRRANLFAGLFIAGSMVFLFGMTLVGPWFVGLVYGPAFKGLQTLIFASSVIQMIQLEQGWLTTLLMANGLTKRFPMITVMRAAAFPAALVFMAWGASILVVPLAFALGATLSLAMSHWAARPLKLIDGRLVVLSFARILVAMGVVLLLARA
jgi:O-antigen/teichoic acid export membrane protein